MLKTIVMSVLFLTVVSALPQENSAKKVETPSASSTQRDLRYFRLDFTVRELDGKRTVSSRNYSTSVSADYNSHRGQGASIRTGNRIPIPATSKDAQFTYSDIGVNIDIENPENVGSELAMMIAADISSLSDTSVGSQSTPPILRSTRWRSQSLVAIGKPTVVFTAEDEHSGHVLELEVTATPLR